jgi:hypothetical protein
VRLAYHTISVFVLAIASAGPLPVCAQQLLGGITGTVVDATGAAVPGAAVTVKNTDTNLLIKLIASSNGSYQAPDLPIGNYSVSFGKEGFKTENHTSILVQGDRTTTVNGKLEVGAVATTVDVTATPLLNQTDTTTGYVLDSDAINNSPLGTGSFTQLAILSPGLSADFLSGAGSNAGLGNQAIWANGQRDSSNSFSINGTSADNLFNGKSTSDVASGRWTLNTGESFQSDGSVQTSGAVYDAIGEGMATPAPEFMQELRVNSGGYDVSQGGKSGAQIETITRSGTNALHGQLYEHLQNTIFNAAPFFRNSSPAYTANNKVPAIHYDRYGASAGGAVIKDKVFYFLGYQGIHDSDALAGQSTFTVPLGLTADRSATGLAAMALSSFGLTVAPSAINQAAINLFNAKVNGQYVIPTPFTNNPATLKQFGYDVALSEPSTFAERQGVADVDYLLNDKERLSFKGFYQDNPTSSPFGSAVLGFPKVTKAGAPTATLSSTTILTPHMTWENRAGVTRQYTYTETQQPFTPQSVGIDIFGSTNFPAITISHSDDTNGVSGKSLTLGSSSNFANAGSYQNNYEGSSTLSWLIGRHTLRIGASWTHTQLNIINNQNNTAQITFPDWPTLFTGAPNTGGKFFDGASNRYYRADQVGAFILDNFKLASNLSLTLGVRYDFDGPLSEKYGNLTGFNPNLYQYNAASDTVVNSGIVVGGNNPILGTKGTSDSTLTAPQWIVAPRIGVAWTPSQLKNVVVRSGIGMYSDRGEYFSELSPAAGSGFNGPFGVTLAPPFVQQVGNTSTGTLAEPFAGATLPPPVTNPAAITALLPNAAKLSTGATPFLFGGYDANNKLPYSVNWTFDLQWQPTNSMTVTVGYVGNHNSHQVLPIPFNQPGIATASNSINGQTTSYGFNVVPSETLKTYDGGNTDLRAPFLGFSDNSVLYEAEGISNYNALQLGLRKRLSHGLQITAAYTYSHTLDEQSNLGLFFEGNNPLNVHSSYGTSAYDRPHVAVGQVFYEIPKAVSGNSLLSKFANGWALSGITSFQSGEPYDIYDYSGSVGGLYYSSFVELINPELPLNPGVTANQAKLQGTTNINPGNPLVNSADFYVPTIAPGTMGVPACTVSSAGAQLCDNAETIFGNTARNLFRGPFQKRLDLSVIKTTRIGERFTLRFQADAFNLTNTPSFDVPNNDLSLYSVKSGVPAIKSIASQTTFGVIQDTIGSPRFMQMSLSLLF